MNTTTATADKAGTRAGYTFSKWRCETSPYKDNDYDAGYSGWTSTQYGPSSGKYYFYPTWKANKYTISYNKNGGSGTTMSSTTATYDSSVTLSTNTYTRTGYTFSG